MQAIATANKQLLSVVMWNNEMVFPWSNHCSMLVASRKTILGSRAGFDSEPKDCAKRVRVRAGPLLRVNGWTLRDAT